MTTATVLCSGKRVLSVECVDHTGYAEEGHDIVCSAVSVLMTTCANAIESVVGIEPKVTVDEQSALLRVELPDGLTERQEHDAQIILQTIVQGLSDIREAYPHFIKLNRIDGRNKPC